MVTKISSRKAKGRNLQKEIVMELREKYNLDSSQGDNCYEGDITARVLGATGTDIVLSPLARSRIPFDVEAKAQEKLNIWSAIKQAESNTSSDRTPLLVFKRNRTDTYCMLKFKDLLELI